MPSIHHRQTNIWKCVQYTISPHLYKKNPWKSTGLKSWSLFLLNNFEHWSSLHMGSSFTKSFSEVQFERKEYVFSLITWRKRNWVMHIWSNSLLNSHDWRLKHFKELSWCGKNLCQCLIRNTWIYLTLLKQFYCKRTSKIHSKI